VEKVEDISCYLLKTQEWDFFMAHFMSTDTIQHYFWHFIDPWHPAYDNRLVHRYKDTIYNIYKKVDKAIGNILELAGNNCNIIILSDHGFAPIYKFFYVNRWLEEKGLLRIKQGTNGLYKWKTALPSVYKILRLMGFESVGSVLPKWLRVLRIPAIKRCPAPLSEWIDWKHTVAYASPFGVNINLKGREPEGIVEKHDYEKVREIVKQELYKLRDSTNGSPVIKKVLYREEVYSGPYINDAADIFFIFKEPYYLQTNEVSKRFYFKELSKDNFATANHRYSPEGILMMCGPNIKRGELKGVNITDVTSTILYLSGLKIPQGLDGRVITEAIRPEYLSTNPVQFSEEGYEHEIDLREVMTDPKDELVKEHLRRLGYLG
jgi:predicted AlkP superfamily phosphohydrolase/phosphomutase